MDEKIAKRKHQEYGGIAAKWTDGMLAEGWPGWSGTKGRMRI